MHACMGMGRTNKQTEQTNSSQDHPGSAPEKVCCTRGAPSADWAQISTTVTAIASIGCGLGVVGAARRGDDELQMIINGTVNDTR